MSSSIVPSAVKVGDYIKFTLKDDASVTYTGKVIGVASYPVARSMGTDLAAKHEQIKASITANAAEAIMDVLDQMFLLVDTGATLPTVVAFEWVSGGAVELIEQGSSYTIKLLDCSKDKAEEAIAILRANGISCKLNVVY